MWPLFYLAAAWRLPGNDCALCAPLLFSPGRHTAGWPIIWPASFRKGSDPNEEHLVKFFLAHRCRLANRRDLFTCTGSRGSGGDCVCVCVLLAIQAVNQR